ncbi:MAG: shikimate kinase [Flavobacteriaceae bacterium]|nr:shikimate kinase [Flavobacteriaceae bacterium]
MQLVLLGYMASGKSTISKILADNVDINFIDLDDYISEKEGDTIKNIFKNKGEIYFRIQENKYLIELLNNQKSIVLAVGGGTPCYSNNMDLINEKSTSIYLKANLNSLFKRLIKEKSDRPLISDLNNDKLKEFIAKHLFERAPYYERADYTINIDDKSIENIVKEVQKLI